MKENDKKLTISAESAQSGDSTEVVNTAAHDMPHPGETAGFDAEGSRNKEAEFEALISGEYKEQFHTRVQKIISRRIKEVKNMQEDAKKNAQIVQSLMEKFNIEDGDREKLERMIDAHMNQNKNSAENRNMAAGGAVQEKTAEILRRLIAENNYLKRSQMEEMQKMQMRNRVEKWRTEAEETKKLYPEFDFEKQLRNPEFLRLLKVGVSVKNAYEVVNIEGILDNHSKDAEKKVVNSIRSKGNRPVENGSESSGGILLSSNVSKLNKKQRAELAKRAAKGERISF